MRINHNIAALNAWRGLTQTDSALGKSLEKLSSGLRINRAGDDAAGLAISEKMRGQIRGLNQAVRNSQDAISMIQTAEGALTEVHSILQRVRELAVQASNDTNTSDDRAEIQQEINQLSAEIDRIGNTTEFNTRKLLNGEAGLQATVTDDAGAPLPVGSQVSVIGGGAGIVAGGDLYLDGVKAAEAATVVFDSTEAIIVGTDNTFSINGITISLSSGDSGAEIAAAVNEVTGQTGVEASYDDVTFTLTFKTLAVGSSAKLELSGLVMTDAGDAGDTFTTATPAAVTMVDQNNNDLLPAGGIAGTAVTVAGDDAEATINPNTTGVDPTSITTSGNIITLHGGDYDGLQLRVDATFTVADDIKIHIDNNNSLTFQIGANAGQSMAVSMGDMRSAALGVDNIDVTTVKNATAALTTIDAAITLVSSERAKLGAYQNRLEHTITNLGASAENLTAAESRIRDVDMASEIMEFTKLNILAQAGTAMMAQANMRPQSILQLLQ